MVSVNVNCSEYPITTPMRFASGGVAGNLGVFASCDHIPGAVYCLAGRIDSNNGDGPQASSSGRSASGGSTLTSSSSKAHGGAVVRNYVGLCCPKNITRECVAARALQIFEETARVLEGPGGVTDTAEVVPAADGSNVMATAVDVTNVHRPPARANEAQNEKQQQIAEQETATAAAVGGAKGAASSNEQDASSSGSGSHTPSPATASPRPTPAPPAFDTIAVFCSGEVLSWDVGTILVLCVFVLACLIVVFATVYDYMFCVSRWSSYSAHNGTLQRLVRLAEWSHHYLPYQPQTGSNVSAAMTRSGVSSSKAGAYQRGGDVVEAANANPFDPAFGRRERTVIIDDGSGAGASASDVSSPHRRPPLPRQAESDGFQRGASPHPNRPAAGSPTIQHPADDDDETQPPFPASASGAALSATAASGSGKASNGELRRGARRGSSIVGSSGGQKVVYATGRGRGAASLARDIALCHSDSGAGASAVAHSGVGGGVAGSELEHPLLASSLTAMGSGGSGGDVRAAAFAGLGSGAVAPTVPTRELSGVPPSTGSGEELTATAPAPTRALSQPPLSAADHDVGCDPLTPAKRTQIRTLTRQVFDQRKHERARLHHDHRHGHGVHHGVHHGHSPGRGHHHPQHHYQTMAPDGLASLSTAAGDDMDYALRDSIGEYVDDDDLFDEDELAPHRARHNGIGESSAAGDDGTGGVLSATHRSDGDGGASVSGAGGAKVRTRTFAKRFLFFIVGSCSLIRNFERWRTFARNSDANVFNAVRVLAWVWLMLADGVTAARHVPGFATALNPHNPLLSVIEAPSLAIHTFLFLSGFLTFQSLNEDPLLQPKTISNPTVCQYGMSFLSYMGARWLRLAPLCLAVLFLAAPLMSHLGNGPFWSTFITAPTLHENCAERWWTNLLFINNVYPRAVADRCLPWSYYFALDFQVYAFGFPLWILRRNFRRRVFFAATLLLAAGSLVSRALLDAVDTGPQNFLISYLCGIMFFMLFGAVNERAKEREMFSPGITPPAPPHNAAVSVFIFERLRRKPSRIALLWLGVLSLFAAVILQWGVDTDWFKVTGMGDQAAAGYATVGSDSHSQRRLRLRAGDRFVQLSPVVVSNPTVASSPASSTFAREDPTAPMPALTVTAAAATTARASAPSAPTSAHVVVSLPTALSARNVVVVQRGRSDAAPTAAAAATTSSTAPHDQLHDQRSFNTGAEGTGISLAARVGSSGPGNGADSDEYRDQALSRIIHSLVPLLWCVGAASSLLPMLFGYGGWPRRVLCHRFWCGLSRLVFAAYLIGPVVIRYMNSTATAPLQATVYGFGYVVWGNICTALVVAFAVHMVFERPIQRMLEKLSATSESTAQTRMAGHD